MAFNRTKLELKLDAITGRPTLKTAFNRTKLELKLSGKRINQFII